MDRTTCARIASLYDGRLQRGYVMGKLTNDPVYAATVAAIAGTQLPLLDLGCGIGLLGQYLSAQGHRLPYVGLDHDERKIVAGQRAAQRAGLDAMMTLRHADAAELPALHGHVALLDMLHYLPAKRQPALLQAAIRHLAPQGCLIIRNVLREPNWRFHATRIEEFFLRASGWIPGGAQHYPTADELRDPLENAGLDVRIEPLRGRTPFNSYLLVARPHC
ncbi:class I SAM-dependent methyltransferase [Rhodanobacter sp. C03]|uniref:class I SAM-dependent methyltransferase n=1 Tax=Rhodanobacter sp. C03 TaxID=1945858 RepID=UPI000987CE93|nr:class I SAM-dependent methyltransferase [Rhodanobacter sp. C03]OOG57347.1 SAM-dependent methyltransferase [Rhodanobacter sp. C03]